MSEPQGLNDFINSDATPVVANPSAPPPGLDEFIKPEVNEEKYGGASGMALSALAGAARSASFGTSDQALVGTGLVKSQTLKDLSDTNPGSTFAGEAAGVIAPALVGDEAGLFGAGVKGASKVGTAITKGVDGLLPQATSVAGQVLKSATSHAVGLGAEGSIYGLGQSISEDALGDHDLLSEHTLANMALSGAMAGGLGAVFGAGMGAIGRDASSGAEKLAMQKAATEAIPGTPESIIHETGLPAKEKSSFIEGLTRQKSNAQDIIDAGKEIGAEVIPAQTSASDYVQSMSSALSQSPTIPGVQLQQTVDRGFDAVRNVIKDTLQPSEHLSPFEAGGKIKDQISNVVDDMYAPIKKAYADREAMGQHIDLPDEARIKMYDGLIKDSQEFGSVGSKGSKVIEAYADRALSQNTVAQMDKLVSEIGGEQRVAFRAGDTETAKALGHIQDTLREFQIKQIAKTGKNLQAEGAESAEAIASDIIREHKEVTAKYRDFKETINDLASDGRLGRKMNTHGTVESVLDAIPNEKIVEKMFDPKNSAGLKRLQDKFPEVFKTIVDNKKTQIFQASIKDGSPDVYKVLKEVDKLSPEMRKIMFSPEELTKLNASKTWVEALPKNVGPSGTPKGMSFMEALQNPVSTVLGHARDYGIKNLLRFSNPAEANKIMFLANAEKQGIKSADKIKTGVSDILDGSNKALRPTLSFGSAKITDEDEYKKKTDTIASIVNNPEDFQNKISDATLPVYQNAPKFSGKLQMKMIGGMQFLNSKIPPKPHPSPFMKMPKASKADISNFNKYYSVVENPHSVLDQIKNRTLTPQAVETMHTVYPQLYTQMKNEIMDQVTKLDDPSEIPYQTRLSISQFMGEPIDPTMSPQSIASNQAVYGTSSQPQQQALKQPKSSQTGLSKMTIADRTSLVPQDNQES